MNHLNPKIALTALVLAMGSPALTACSDAAPPGDVEQTGTLTAALLTTGSDGALYQFPAGTVIHLTKPGYDDSFPVDGTESTLTLHLPAGTYNVELVFPNTTPQLDRTVGSTTTTVDATWLDLQPVSVLIGADMFTDLTLHFAAIGLGDVTFDMGNLVLALEVQRDARTQAAQLWENGQYQHAFHLFGTSATEGLQTYLAESGAPHFHFLDFNINGPWTQINAQELCSTTLLDVFTTQDGESGFSRATNLLISQIGTICIVDNGANDQFYVNTAVSGPAQPALQGILPGTNYRMFLSVSGNLGDVYNGQTFQQSRFEKFTSFTGGLITHQIYDNTIPEETYYAEGFLFGQIRLLP